MSDSGRVQDIVQGRHLITPDELISLNKEVIVFTADTKPLKLPLTDPTAYDQALSYDPPTREKHEVSEFIKKRGRTARTQNQERAQTRDPEPPPQPPTPKPKPKPQPQAESNARFDRQRTPAKLDKDDREETPRKPYPQRPKESPDYDP